MNEGSTDRFTFRHPVDVRYRDVDGAGHVHHSQALVYFEEARTAYWREVVAGDGEAEVPRYVLAEVGVEYHRRIRHPARIEVGVAVAELGRKHLVLEYEARDVEGELLLSGHTVVVLFDYEAETTVPVPDAVRRRIEEREGPVGRGGGAGSG